MYHHFSFCLGIPWRRVGKLAWVSAAYAFFFHMFAFFDGRRSPQRISMTDGSQHSTWPKWDSLPEAFIVYFKHSTKRVNKLDDTHLPSDNGGRDTWMSRWLHLLEGPGIWSKLGGRKRSGRKRRDTILPRFCIREVGGLV